MRIVTSLIIATLLSGCAATYKQSNLIEPAARLFKGRSVVIATPVNGFYASKEYSGSGRATAHAVRAAFARFSNSLTVSTGCTDITCLKRNNSSHFDYSVNTELLHWEDRAPACSGLPDKIEIKLPISEGQMWKELASTIISGKSK